MALDPRFIPLNYLQEYFVDKTTGAPMSAGVVSFYSDINRSTPKNVYTISGTPPTYTYTSLGSILTLGSTGTFVDPSGNDISVYAFPLDGTPTTTTNVIDNYFIDVKNSGGVDQFTREGVPNVTTVPGQDPEADVTLLTNFVPNGQFLLHNEHNVIPGTALVYPSLGTLDVTNVAPGGISFERTDGSTATDTVTFPQTVAYRATPSKSPRYALKVVRSVASAGGDAVCDIRIKWMDVFKFYGTAVTFAFTAKSNTGSTNVNLHTISYFGANGANSADDLIPNSTLTVTSQDTAFVVNFTFPSPTSSAQSTNDDFIQIAIRLPSGAGQTFNIEFNDFYLVRGTFTLNTINQATTGSYFPIITNGEFMLGALSNLAQTTSTPGSSAYYAQDGSNLYLPIIMTPSGFTYDQSTIGTIEGKMTNTAVNNELLCNGQAFSSTGYSTLGIPYSRLFNVLFDSTVKAPLFGTGTAFSQGYINSGGTTQFVLNANAIGNNTAPTNGTSSPSFTYKPTVTGRAATINYRAYANSGGFVNAISTFTGGTNGGATVADGGGGNATGMGFANNHLATNQGYFYEFLITTVSAAALAKVGTARYFTFSNAGTNYYVWFVVTTETDPAPGGTGIEIDLTPSMLAADVAALIAQAINGFSANTITVGAASTITSGNYFSFATNGNATTYNVWYNKAAAGGAPNVANLIEVALTGSETAAQVATATISAINSMFFAVPDLRGVFLRGADPTSIWDIDSIARYQNISSRAGTSIGSFQLDTTAAHQHNGVGGTAFVMNGGVLTVGAIGNSFSTQNTTAASAGTETRPVNAYVNWWIKY